VVLRDARGGGTREGDDPPPPHRGDEHREPAGRRERVELANGEYLDVDHVIVTSGHTGNVEPDANAALIPRPYPVDRYTETIPRGATVGVEGMGLVATDVVIALTVGRGGSFTESGDRLRYLSSGMSQDSGCSPAADSVLLEGRRNRGRERRIRGRRLHQGSDRGGPGRSSNGQARRQINFRSQVLPLILAEMQIRYYAQSALLASVARPLTRSRGFSAPLGTTGHMKVS